MDNVIQLFLSNGYDHYFTVLQIRTSPKLLLIYLFYVQFTRGVYKHIITAEQNGLFFNFGCYFPWYQVLLSIFQIYFKRKLIGLLQLQIVLFQNESYTADITYLQLSPSNYILFLKWFLKKYNWIPLSGQFSLH